MPDRVARSNTATATVAAVTAIRMPGTRGRRFRTRIRTRVLTPTASATRFVLPAITFSTFPSLPDRSVRGDRKAKQLRDLAQHHRQRDAVHVAVAYRLREQLSDEAESSIRLTPPPSLIQPSSLFTFSNLYSFPFPLSILTYLLSTLLIIIYFPHIYLSLLSYLLFQSSSLHKSTLTSLSHYNLFF
jgi:hypothetical protein